MTVNCDELSLLVDELFVCINPHSKEAVFRAYINRSYYVIYHYCKNYIETHLPQYKLTDDGTFKTGTHNRIFLVFEDLAKHNHKARALSIKFRDFLDKRHRADYQLADTIGYYDYMQCKKHFETIPKLLNALV